MLDEGRISSVQLLLMLYIFEIATLFMIIPAVTVGIAGPDGWISVLFIDSLYGVPVALVAVALARRFPRQIFTEYLPLVLGLVPGKLLALIYTLVFIHLASVVISENSIYFHSVLLTETPMLMVDVVMVLVAVYGVYLGIEVIARQNEVVFVAFMISITVLFALVAKEIRLYNLQPVLANGIVPVVKASVIAATYRGDVFVLLMLYPYLNQKQEAFKSAMGMQLLAATSAAIILATTIGVFGDLYTSHQVFTGHSLARYISIGMIVERMEMYLVMIWVAGTLVRLTVLLHCGCTAAASTLGIKNYRWTIIPVALTALIISGTVYDHSYLNLYTWITRVWPIGAYAVQLLIPAAVLMAAVIRKKGDRQRLTDKGKGSSPQA